MSFDYSNLNVNGGGSYGDKSPLPPGKYQSNPKKGVTVEGSSLTVLKLLAPRELASGGTRHSFLIGSDEVNGTAFLKIDVQDFYLTPEACALAFGKKDKNNTDPFQLPADTAGLDPAVLEATQNRITEVATEKVIAANTPAEAQHDATETAIHNILLQIQINVGTIFRLQDWAGLDRNPQGDLSQLEQTQFEGAVKASNLPNGAPEVSVFSKPKEKVAQKSAAASFNTAKM